MPRQAEIRDEDFGPTKPRAEKLEVPGADRPVSQDQFIVQDGPHKGEIVNFFPRGAETPTFLRRHGRLFRREG